MAKQKPLIDRIKQHRFDLGLNQTDYWARYGVTQSAGSRYEHGQHMPTSVALLVQLHLTGMIVNSELLAARRSI